ncbi:MAG TPA: DMT family transporter [Thermomicrobiales bacterium]|nr:DMT family transporter [Thermomicrobiales bacterium]
MNDRITAGERFPAFLALASSMGIVGASMTANKFIVGNIPIMLASGIRCALATLVMLVLVRLVDTRLPHIPRNLHITLALQAFTGIFAFNVLALLGVGMTTATISGIITAMTPAVIAIISFALGDRLARIAWLGIVLTIAGVVLVNLLATPSDEEASRPLLGAILIFFAVCAEAMYTIFGRRVAGRISPISSTAYMCLYSAAMFLPFALWDLTNTDVMEVPVSTWLAIAYLAVFASGVAVILWFFGLRTTPASTAGAFTGVIPITAVLSAWFLLDERIGWAHVAGIALVIAGIFLVVNAQGRRLATLTDQDPEPVAGIDQATPV